MLKAEGWESTVLGPDLCHGLQEQPKAHPSYGGRRCSKWASWKRWHQAGLEGVGMYPGSGGEGARLSSQGAP